ncbi:hypothetical protein ACFL4O_01145 [bacterium]
MQEIYIPVSGLNNMNEVIGKMKEYNVNPKTLEIESKKVVLCGDIGSYQKKGLKNTLIEMKKIVNAGLSNGGNVEFLVGSAIINQLTIEAEKMDADTNKLLQELILDGHLNVVDFSAISNCLVLTPGCVVTKETNKIVGNIFEGVWNKTNNARLVEGAAKIELFILANLAGKEKEARKTILTREDVQNFINIIKSKFGIDFSTKPEKLELLLTNVYKGVLLSEAGIMKILGEEDAQKVADKSVNQFYTGVPALDKNTYAYISMTTPDGKEVTKKLPGEIGPKKGAQAIAIDINMDGSVNVKLTKEEAKIKDIAPVKDLDLPQLYTVEEMGIIRAGIEKSKLMLENLPAGLIKSVMPFLRQIIKEKKGTAAQLSNENRQVIEDLAAAA